jgi:hypothetical protein
MFRRNVLRAALLAGVTFLATGSHATTLYLGVEPSTSSSITNLANDSATPGSASYSAGGTFGGLTIKTLSATELAPPPDLGSSTMDVTAALSSGSAKIYVSETNQTALNFLNFSSLFSVTGFNTGVNGTAMSVVESTYATPCTGAGGSCTASDIFSTGQLLSTYSFTSTGTPPSANASINPDLSVGDYVVTLVYTIAWQTFTGADHGNVTASMELLGNGSTELTTPLPAAVWMMGSVLAGGAGFGTWRRKRKAAAIAA